MASYNRKQGLDTATLTKAVTVLERALNGGHSFTRGELALELERADLVAKGMRLGLFMLYAELEGIVCSGPRRGKQFTYALLSERTPGGPCFSREEALAELTKRYFTSHAPATIRDFVWWSGLSVADTRRGLEMNGARSELVNGLTYWRIGRHTAGRPLAGMVHLLPIYDEYIIAYRDRDAVPHGPTTFQPVARAVTFQHALIINGEVTGTWRTIRDGGAVAIEVFPLRRLSRAERAGIAERGEQFARFLGAGVPLSIR
jgi:hypothetical protein